MSHLKLEVWAFPFDHEPVPLPDLRGWKISPTDGDWGSISIDYPSAGRGYEFLDVVTDDDVDLEIELTVTDNAGHRWVRRGLLLDHSGDDVAEQEVVTLTGVFLDYLFSEVVVPYFPGGENGETPVAGTAGRIARELLQAAQARGALVGVTWDFTDTEDSSGAPWARSGNLRFSPGQTYSAVLGTLRGYQLSEWTLGPDRVLHLYNPDGNGVDRTLGANPLTLERGRDLADAPRKHTLRGAITALITAGKDGLYSSAVDATATSRRRRRIEAFYSFGNAAEQGSLDALTQSRLATVTTGQLSLSHKLALGPGHPSPLLDFGPADWVFSAGRRGPTRRRVKQVTLEGTADEVNTASVTLNALIDEVATRQQAQIDALASGAATVGTSTPPPDVDPGTTPAPPVGADVVATSLWYSTSEGVGLTSVTAAWSPVPDTTVEGYIVEWRYNSGGLSPDWQQLPQVAGTTVTWSAVAAGEVVEVRVYAVNKWGRSSPPSSPVWSFTTEQDGTPPPIASTPTPYATLGLVVVPWNGRGSANEPMPGDFDATEVHISTTSGFTANRPLNPDGSLNTAASTTYAGEMRGAMEWPIDVGVAGYGTTFYVVLVTRDRSNNAVGQSAQGSVVARAVADNEIGAMSIGKLTAGILTAIMTVSGMIRTSLTGARVELDGVGLRCISSTGAILFEFNIPNSLLTLVGKFATSASTSAARIVVDPAFTDRGGGTFPSMVLYSASGTKGPARLNASDQSGGNTALGINSGPSTAAGAFEQGTVFVFPDRILVSCNAGEGGVAATDVRGARLVIERSTGATLQGFPSGGAANAVSTVQARNDGVAVLSGNSGASIFGGNSAAIESNGNVNIRAAGNTPKATFGTEIDFWTPPGGGNGFAFKANGGRAEGYLLTAVGGVLRFWSPGDDAYLGDGNGGMKSFVIPHPLDSDRWLVHGCTESPTAGVEYWGEAVLLDHTVEVPLPEYFEALTRPNRQVFVTMMLPAEPLTVEVPSPPPPPPRPPFAWAAQPPPAILREHALLHPVAASTPRNGRFRIVSPAPDGTRVSWLVKAERDLEFDVEPHRDAVDVTGYGPYLTATEKGLRAA